MPLVIKPIAFACLGERLAGATSGPDGAIVGPAGGAEGVGPSADTGKEVALNVSRQVTGRNVSDVALVNVAGRKKSICNEVAEPSGGMGINLVVV